MIPRAPPHRCRGALVLLAALAACTHAGGRDALGPPADAGEWAQAVSTVDGVRLVVRYERGEDRDARDVQRVLPVAVARARRWGPLESATIVVHRSDESFRAATGETGRSALRAWTIYDQVHVRSPNAWGLLGAGEREVQDVLAHELVHCVANQRIGDRDAWARRPLPFWFREGMGIDVPDDQVDRAIRARLRTFESRRTPPTGESALARAGALLPEYPDLAYATAYVAFRELLGHGGDAVVGRILDGVREGAPFAESFAAAAGLPVEAFDAEVRAAIVTPR